MIKLTVLIEDGHQWNESPILFNVGNLFSIMTSKKTRSIPILGSEDNVQHTSEVWMSDGLHFWVKETVDEIWDMMNLK